MGPFQGPRPWGLLVRCNFSPCHLQLGRSCTSWPVSSGQLLPILTWICMKGLFSSAVH